MKKFALIVAGGTGKRMGQEIPKQFLLLDGLPILMHTINCFSEKNIPGIEIILTLPSSEIANWQALCSKYNFSTPHRIVSGGEERYHSVKNGLDAIGATEGLVAIHDGVRPLLDATTITETFIAAEKHGAAVPVVPMKESIRKISGSSSAAVDRTAYVAVQTPQCFQLELIKKVYNQPYSAAFTDDASVAEAAGFPVFLTKGSYRNIKITTPEDLAFAAALIAH